MPEPQIEKELRNRFVKTNDIAIIEITCSEREIQICNKHGELVALRKYSRGSPIYKTVALLAQMIQGDGYNYE